MKYFQVILLFLLASSDSFSQTTIIDSTLSNDFRKQNVFGFDPSYQSTINGITLKYWWTNSSITSNGVFIDTDIFSLLTGTLGFSYTLVALPHIMFSSQKDTINNGKVDTVIARNKVNGISFSPCSIRYNKTITNGVSISALISGNDKVNGVSLGLVNATTEFNGLMLSSVNISKQGKGVMFGFINLSETLKGVQFGLWNRIGDFGFPFMNLRF